MKYCCVENLHSAIYHGLAKARVRECFPTSYSSLNVFLLRRSLSMIPGCAIACLPPLKPRNAPSVFLNLRLRDSLAFKIFMTLHRSFLGILPSSIPLMGFKAEVKALAALFLPFQPMHCDVGHRKLPTADLRLFAPPNHHDRFWLGVGCRPFTPHHYTTPSFPSSSASDFDL